MQAVGLASVRIGGYVIRVFFRRRKNFPHLAVQRVPATESFQKLFGVPHREGLDGREKFVRHRHGGEGDLNFGGGEGGEGGGHGGGVFLGD